MCSPFEGTMVFLVKHELTLVATRTSDIGSVMDKTLSGAFLTSSMNSGPETSIIHVFKVATLNIPGLA